MSKENQSENTLAQVLSQLKDLTAPAAGTALPVQDWADSDVPVLDEIYHGEPLVFNRHLLDDFPVLESDGMQLSVGSSASLSAQRDPEIISLLREAIAHAVEKELESLRPLLCRRLEAELTATLLKDDPQKLSSNAIE